MDNFFWGSLTKSRQEQLINLIMSIDQPEASFLSNNTLISNGMLTWFQSFAVEHAMISKSTLLSLGTGLGKTITACGYSERILKENSGTKVLFICLPESIEQIEQDFLNYTTRDIICVTGETSSINTLKYNIDSFEIIIASYQAFYSLDFCNLIIDYIFGQNRISAVIADEVHEISQESLINSILKSFLTKIEYKLFLTATPITVEPEQLITLLNLLDNEIFPEGRDYLKPYRILDPETFEVLDYRHLDNLANNLFPHYLSWTRAELGINGTYHPELILVKPDEEQLTAKLSDIPTIIKGKRNSNQVKTFVQLCRYLVSTYKKGLVYASRHENSKILCEELLDVGIKAVVVNGETDNKKVRQDVLQDFRNNKIDIIITNLTTSLNMDSDFLIYWENTNRAVQMLGRCERGFTPKDLYIYYILTEDTVELQQFYKNVYRRCKWLKESLDKDVSIFERFNNALQTYYKKAEIVQQSIQLD